MQMKIIFMSMLLAASSLAQAKEGGNGGGVSVCRLQTTAGESILEARLYDFVEAEILNPQEKIIEGQAPYRTQLADILEEIKRLSPRIGAAYEEELKLVEKNLVILPLTFERIYDSNNAYLPEHCRTSPQRPEYMQAARYVDEAGRLEIAKSIFEVMAPTDQAGLILHELTYRLTRKIGFPDSTFARQITAYFFSERSAKITGQIKTSIDLLESELFTHPEELDQEELNFTFLLTKNAQTASQLLGGVEKVYEYSHRQLFPDANITKEQLVYAVDKTQITFNGTTCFNYEENGAVYAEGPYTFLSKEQLGFFMPKFCYRKLKRREPLTKLMLAVVEENGEMVQALLKQPELDPNWSNPFGTTALHLAAANGSVELLQLLLRRSDLMINAKTLTGLTPLMSAILMNQKNTAEVLLRDARVDRTGLSEFLVSQQPVEKSTADRVPHRGRFQRLLKK